jgi:hypothetical protein
VDSLITTVHRINARADTKVTNEFVTELKRVAGKENILFKMTKAALCGPDRLVSEVIYPAVPGRAETLAALLQEYQTQGTGYRQHKQRVFKASYTNHIPATISVWLSGKNTLLSAPPGAAADGRAKAPARMHSCWPAREKTGSSASHDLSPCRAQLTNCWRETQYTLVTPRILLMRLASLAGAAAPRTTADGTRHLEN